MIFLAQKADKFFRLLSGFKLSTRSLAELSLRLRQKKRGGGSASDRQRGRQPELLVVRCER